jgi:hypothetical protein
MLFKKCSNSKQIFKGKRGNIFNEKSLFVLFFYSFAVGKQRDKRIYIKILHLRGERKRQRETKRV